MALITQIDRSTTWRSGLRWPFAWWITCAIRSLLVAYLVGIVILHATTLPHIYARLSAPCIPGWCQPGQVSQETLDWLGNRGISPELYAFAQLFLLLLIPIAGGLLAGITIWQRPTAWLPMMFVIAISSCTLHASGALYELIWMHPNLEWVMTWGAIPMTVMWPLIIPTFPDGRFVPRWSAVAILVSAFDLFLILQPDMLARMPEWVGTADRWAWIAFAAICIPWRLRTTTSGNERRQTRIWGIALVPMLAATVLVAFLQSHDVINPEVGGVGSIVIQVSWSVSILWILTGFMLAVYLYHLYDLTVVIRRSLVYGILSVALMGLYLMVTGGISLLMRKPDSLLTNLLATTLVALCFAPLRDRIQQGVYRLLYGDQRDPYAVVTRFGERFERESAPERLLQSVVDLAQESLQVPGVALQVHGLSGLETRSGHLGARPTTIPVRYKGEDVGTFSVAPRSPADIFSPADQRLIEEIARQLGIAVQSILQAEELRHSRERIVTAREEERRRIRRDLHDGLGPTLAALSLHAEIARDLIETDAQKSAELLDAVLVQARDSIQDVRRLVYGLRPPSLDDLGLIGAIQAQRDAWETQGLRVTLNLARDLPPLSAATEVAIFRIVQESITNTIRHAAAAHAVVALNAPGNTIRLEIRDDGQGLPADIIPGVGMHSMAERAAELGGEYTIANAPGGGVVVRATFSAPGEASYG